VILSYPDVSGGAVGEIVVDARTHEIISHTPIAELRDKGQKLAQELSHRARLAANARPYDSLPKIKMA
jgi:hypothetical protein